jgi:hypothetical protein
VNFVCSHQRSSKSPGQGRTARMQRRLRLRRRESFGISRKHVGRSRLWWHQGTNYRKVGAAGGLRRSFCGALQLDGRGSLRACPKLNMISLDIGAVLHRQTPCRSSHPRIRGPHGRRSQTGDGHCIPTPQSAVHKGYLHPSVLRPASRVSVWRYGLGIAKSLGSRVGL